MWNTIKQWLTTHLTNSWMTNNNFIAFMAHSLGALSVILVTAYLSNTALAAIITVTASVWIFATLKEFVYDMLYEVPKQTLKDSTLDWVGYMAGIAVAWIIVAIWKGTH